MSGKKVFDGKDLEEALGKAAAALGIPEDDVHYRFIDEGRRGIMGLGARSVQIEVEETATTEPAPPAEPKPERAGRERGRRGRRPSRKREPAPQEAAEGKDRPGSEGGRRGSAGNRSGRKARGRGNRRDRRNRTDRRPQGTERRAPAPAVEVNPEQMEQVAVMVRNLIRTLELDLAVAAEPGRTGVRLELTGDQELLQRNDSEFPQAVQFLLNRMSRRAWPEVGRIQVLSEGFRNERDEELVEEVREVAGQVAHTGEPKTLHPMNPYERRIVHITVREFEGLQSESVGDGFRKKITISRAGSLPAESDA